MTYLEKIINENGNNEFVLHFNFQESLLLRSVLINQMHEYESLYKKDTALIKEKCSDQIKRLFDIDSQEIKFRIQKVKQFINLFDHELSKS